MVHWDDCLTSDKVPYSTMIDLDPWKLVEQLRDISRRLDKLRRGVNNVKNSLYS